MHTCTHTCAYTEEQDGQVKEPLAVEVTVRGDLEREVREDHRVEAVGVHLDKVDPRTDFLEDARDRTSRPAVADVVESNIEVIALPSRSSGEGRGTASGDIVVVEASDLVTQLAEVGGGREPSETAADQYDVGLLWGREAGAGLGTSGG